MQWVEKKQSTVSSADYQGIPITITEMKKAPGMMKEEVVASMQGQKMTVQKKAFNGTKGYNEAQGQRADLKPEEVADSKEEADLYSDLHPEKYGIKRTLKGMEAINGSNAYILEVVDAKNKKSTEYYDAKTGLLVRKIETAEGPQGPVTSTTEYKDYREVPGTNGYKVPYSVTQQGAGQPTISATMQSVEINKGIPDTEFN